MPYKDKEKRRNLNRERLGRKVDVTCYICGNITQVRYDTSVKYTKFTCSKECKSQLVKQVRTTTIDEKAFILEYQSYKLGYQSLCKKYHISGDRGKTLLKEANILILSAIEMRSEMFNKGEGAWLREEERTCKHCGKVFKFRKGSTEGFFCSHKCYMNYRGRTSIEIKIANLLANLDIKFEEQYKIDKKYYDFYLPKYNLLIESDGDYWHSLPNNIENDKFKDNLAYNKKYKLIRFTEFNINNNLDEIKEYLMKMIKTKKKVGVKTDKRVNTSWLTNNNKEGE